MSKLVEIKSRTGKCLCHGCPIFIEDKFSSCPISGNTDNSTLKGEKLNKYKRGEQHEHMWCDFKYCGISTVSEDEIKNNPGYRIMEPNNRTMWIPQSIVISIPKEKKGRAIKSRSKLAWLATK